MKYQLSIGLACLLGLTMVGCDRREETSTAPKPESPQPAAASAGEPAADALTSVQDASQAPPPTDVACGAVHPPQDKVKAGEYCVCDIGTHEVHVHHKAKHLEKGQSVVINPLDWVTDVQLGSNPIQMVRSEDETQLTAVVPYQHQKTRSSGSEDVTHFVRISPEKKLKNLEGTNCDSTKNVLRISFCYQDDDKKWSCEPQDGLHNGDTHVQN